MRSCRRTPRTAAAEFQAAGGQASEERHGQGSSASRCGIQETLTERRLRIGRPAHVTLLSLWPGHKAVAMVYRIRPDTPETKDAERKRKRACDTAGSHATLNGMRECVRVPTQLTHRHVPQRKLREHEIRKTVHEYKFENKLRKKAGEKVFSRCSQLCVCSKGVQTLLEFFFFKLVLEPVMGNSHGHRKDVDQQVNGMSAAAPRFWAERGASSCVC